MTAAPLKPLIEAEFTVAPLTIRGHMTAAPLKPRLDHSSGVMAGTIRGHMTAAPLKQHPKATGECPRDGYPRSHDRGPIEALMRGFLPSFTSALSAVT